MVDAANQSVRRVIKAKQGLGPMGFSADGRFGIVLNTLENRASVIDAATDSLIHQLDVSAGSLPGVVFTRGLRLCARTGVAQGDDDQSVVAR